MHKIYACIISTPTGWEVGNNYILMGDFEMASIGLVCGYPWKPMFANDATNDTICVYVGRNFHYTRELYTR